jgi:hypothetical protein
MREMYMLGRTKLGLGGTSENSVIAKCGIALVHTGQDRRRSGKRKAGPISGEGESQRRPGLTIDRIVVPEQGRAYTPNGISLYAGWLLLTANFGEFTFHALR